MNASLILPRPGTANVAICIATCQRPVGLQRLLESLDAVAYDAGCVEIFIAENDMEVHAGLDYVEANHARHRHKITIAVEPEPGIAFARNRCMALAMASDTEFAYFAFTDDDNAVLPNWLEDMVRTALLYDAKVVFGKREPLFEVVPEDAVLHCRFFSDDFQCPVTGAEISEGSTSNMLIGKSVFDTIGYTPFNTEIGLSGGEDTDICRQMTRCGYRFVACASAVCYEYHPARRLTAAWMTTRYFRTGSTYGYLTKRYRGTFLFGLRILQKTLIFPLLYAIFVVRGDLSSKCRLYNTLGFFYFVAKGTSYPEYRRDHGSGRKMVGESGVQKSWSENLP